MDESDNQVWREFGLLVWGGHMEKDREGWLEFSKYTWFKMGYKQY